MTEFTLSRADIRATTGWRYRITRGIIESPYRLNSIFDPSAVQGGGRIERFRLSDVLARVRSLPHFQEGMAARLIAADAAYRNSNKSGDMT